jgi:hypothetical protein
VGVLSLLAGTGFVAAAWLVWRNAGAPSTWVKLALACSSRSRHLRTPSWPLLARDRDHAAESPVLTSPTSWFNFS